MSMSDHFNRAALGEGARGLLERAVRNNDTETIKKLLQPGMVKQDPPPKPAAPQAAAEPPAPPPEKVSVDHDIDLLKPMKVRSRTGAMQGRRKDR